MENFYFPIFIFLFAFFVSLGLLIVVYRLLKKLKAKQTIYEYVDFHQSKSGTPTMGGLSFVLGSILSIVFLLSGYILPVIVCVAVMFFNGAVGVLDDMVKIKRKKNGGLKPWQKLMFQTFIFGVFGLFLIKLRLTQIIIPFFKINIDLGFCIVPLCIIVGLFFTNCTNLADGLDGLECFIAMPCSCCLGVILLLISALPSFDFLKNAELINDFGYSLIIFSGAIFSFLFYNSYPAKIFMGDTGSLAIGSFLVAVGFASGTIIYLLLFGILFVITGLSVLIQVAYYKLTKKRIFLMAPLHHHFEKKGYHESKIAIVYFMITTIFSLLIILLELI